MTILITRNYVTEDTFLAIVIRTKNLSVKIFLFTIGNYSHSSSSKQLPPLNGYRSAARDLGIVLKSRVHSSLLRIFHRVCVFSKSNGDIGIGKAANMSENDFSVLCISYVAA